MKDFLIMTDSCCDLPREYILSKEIPFVSLTCLYNGREYRDDFGKSLSSSEFFNGMRQGATPKTSQPNAEAFYDVFMDIIKQGKDILYICVSSGLSGTYNSANIARTMVSEEGIQANITIVDTLTASLGQGIMVIKAVEMKEQGATFGEIVEWLENNKQKLNTYITVDDLNHLKRGGRISSAAAFIGIVLHVKPVLTISHEGKVLPVFKIKGKKNVINKLADLLRERTENPEDQVLAICHGDAEEDALKLKEIISAQVKCKEILINDIGPVVGSHGGPGALALFFFGKDRQHNILD